MNCDGFNGSTSMGLGSVTTTLKLRSCVTVLLTFLVVELGKAHDIILGQEAMKRLHVILDFAGESIMLRDSSNKQHTLSNATRTTNSSRPQCTRVSLKKARKVADANSFVCFVRTTQCGCWWEWYPECMRPVGNGALRECIVLHKPCEALTARCPA